jgi:hypothetical protein
VTSEIATLQHKLRDHAVEAGALVGQGLGRGALLASAECSEVLASFGTALRVQGHFNSTSRLTIDGNIKEHDSRHDIEKLNERIGEFSAVRCSK